jgi:hypothetical protein
VHTFLQMGKRPRRPKGPFRPVHASAITSFGKKKAEKAERAISPGACIRDYLLWKEGRHGQIRA